MPGVRTTPEGTDLQRLFARMRDRDVAVVAMEVSSHGLALHRIDGTHVAVAVFTNLSQDHLDFHGDMASYAAAKARLFTPGLAARGIVDVEDDWGRWMADRAEVPVVTVGSHDTDVRRRVVRADLDGTDVVLEGPRDVLGGAERVELHTPLVGGFNGHNVSDAFLAAVAAGTDATPLRPGSPPAPGRRGGSTASTPASPSTCWWTTPTPPTRSSAVVDTLRPLTSGRVLVVVGAGGDRDRGKRPLMGAAAAQADVAVLTSDNPRQRGPRRDPRPRSPRVPATPRRPPRSSWNSTVAPASPPRWTGPRPGDVVVIAGKGHETTQAFADHVEPFDDRAGRGRAARRRTGRRGPHDRPHPRPGRRRRRRTRRRRRPRPRASGR